MEYLKAWVEFERQKDEFRHLEKALELPKGSITSEYEKTLVLSGMQINEVKSIHAELIEISTETVFRYQTIISIHERVKDVAMVKKICHWASGKAVDPHVIVDIINK